MNISVKDIQRQYARAKAEGWMPLFEETAQTCDTSTAHMLAIGSRETNLKNIKGDFREGKYHGFGIMQVDIGTDPEFAANWSPKNFAPGITRGGEIYQSKVDQVFGGQGRTLTVKGKRFKGRTVENDDIRRIATAAYNCGLWAYFHFSNETNVDLSTTDKDYSRDVYDRAIEFAALREKDGEVNAVATEIMLQGKYARADRVAAPEVPEKKDLPVTATDTEETVREPPTDAGQPVLPDAAKPGEAVIGGRPGDEPKKMSTGGPISRWLTAVGGGTGVMTAIGGFIKGEKLMMVVGLLLAWSLVMTLMFRQVIMDYLRMKMGADPSKYNVK